MLQRPIALSLMIIVMVSSCLTDNSRPALAINGLPVSGGITKESNTILKKLKDSIKNDPIRKKAVEDVLAILEARSFEEAGELKKATKSWFEAIQLSDQLFAEDAFYGWIHSYIKTLGKVTDQNLLARLILKETNGGKHGLFMKEKKLQTEESLLPILKAAMAGTRYSKMKNKTFLPPQQEGADPNDLLLEKTAQEYCNHQTPDNYQWKAWVKTLNPLIQEYWHALVLVCKNKPQKAISTLERLSPSLAEQPSTRAYGIAAYEKLAQLQRHNSKREEAAKTYLHLLKTWQRPGLSHRVFGLSEKEFMLKKINDFLWAARYQAVISQYEKARLYTEQALELIRNAPSELQVMTGTTAKQLAEYHAEAQHILAFRIALEEKEYTKATSILTIALQIPNLPEKWQQKLLWSTGFLSYLEGQKNTAIKHWQELLKNSPPRHVAAKAHFWIAKCYHELSKNEKRDKEVAILKTKFPLSFYSINALSMSKIASPIWEEKHFAFDRLKGKLLNKRAYDIAAIYDNKKIKPSLLRAETLIQAKAHEWSKKATLHLYKLIKKTMKFKTNKEVFIYLARLLYASGNYFESIGINTLLDSEFPNFWQDWPEQILVHYPRPYANIYRRRALENSVDVALLFAISRQESSFRADAESSAKAKGLMQIMKSTAERVARSSGIPINLLDQSLNRPEVNIQLGSLYVKILQLRYKGFQPAIVASYNAGEYPVDKWIKTRWNNDALVWIELIPFEETRNYVKSVWRSVYIYQHLKAGSSKITAFRGRLVKKSHHKQPTVSK